MSQKYDEINFLLTNVNENAKPKSVVSSIRKEKEGSSNSETPIYVSNSSAKTTSLDENSNESSNPKHNRRLARYLCIGFVELVIIMGFMIGFGLLNSIVVFIFWILCWICVLTGTCFCVYRRFIFGMHLCNGAVVGLIFGILTTACFLVHQDIEGRPRFSVTAKGPMQQFSDGAIIYFSDGFVDTNIIGESIDSEGSYYCVSPILVSYNLNISNIIFWAFCQNSKYESCTSQAFNQSECYINWFSNWQAGFIVNQSGISQSVFEAAEDAISTYKMNNTKISFNTTVAVMWVPNPGEQAKIFYGLGIFLTFVAPIVYFVYGGIYALLCRGRGSPQEYMPLIT